MKLGELAARLGAPLIGNSDIEIQGVSGLDVVKEGSLTFIMSEKHLPALQASAASAVIVPEEMKEISIPQIIAENPLLFFAKALDIFYGKVHIPQGVVPGAFVSPQAVLGKDITVYPTAYVSDRTHIGDGTVLYPGVYIGEGTSIGAGCIIYPNVTIRDGVQIGSRVTIHPGSVVGSDGYGYVLSDGIHHKIPQVGGVIIEDDVEIGACVTIDRATSGYTVIGEGSKIDNLVQIAHNVTIGKHSLVVAQVGIAGSARLGDYVTLAGQVGVADHAVVESHTTAGAKSGLMGRVSKGTYMGTLAQPHREFFRSYGHFRRLPQLVKRITLLENALKELRDRLPEKGGNKEGQDTPD